jgi:hypothetical protein
MRILSAGLLLSVLGGCGSEGDEIIDEQDSSDECRICEGGFVDKGVEIRMRPHVAVQPDQIMFYGELASGEQLPPEEARVVNRTTQPILVTRVYVVDKPNDTFGPGSAAYFAVSGLDGAQILYPGHSLALTVSFKTSARQRAALLMIETSETGIDGLTVELSGKYFD